MDGIPLQWIQSLRPTTRTIVISTLGLSLSEHIIFEKPLDFSISYDNLLNRSTLWKLPLNAVHMRSLSLTSMTSLYFFTEYSNELEILIGSSTEYAWLILAVTIILLFYSVFVSHFNFLSYPLRDILIYIWTKKNPNLRMRFFIFQFNSQWFPWINLSMENMFQDNVDAKKVFSTIFIGHVVWYMNDFIPKVYRCRSIFTPIWKWNERLVLEEGDNEIEDQHLQTAQELPLNEGEQQIQVDEPYIQEPEQNLDPVDTVYQTAVQRATQNTLNQRD